MIIDRDYQKDPLQVLSFGGGVQSTAMLLMVHEGILPRPDVVMFADTGSELPETLQHIEDNARPFIEQVLKIPFIIARSQRGTLHDDYMRLSAIPMIGIRSCTDNFKISPQRKEIRKIVGNRNGILLAECWMGITTDESKRKPKIKDPREPKWIEKTYPLLDLIPTSRADCQEMNDRHNWSVVKSGCFCCPYQSTKSWQKLKLDHPELFEISLEMERMKNIKRPGKMGLHQEKPLSTIEELNLPDSMCDSGGCFI